MQRRDDPGNLGVRGFSDHFFRNASHTYDKVIEFLMLVWHKAGELAGNLDYEAGVVAQAVSTIVAQLSQTECKCRGEFVFLGEISDGSDAKQPS